ncbi:MAG: exosortase N [Bacteroidota bacterium]
MQISYHTILFLWSEYLYRKRQIIALAALILLVAVAWKMMRIYLIWDFNLYLGLVFLPFIVYVRQPGVFSYRFGILSLIMLGLYIPAPVLTIFYAAFCFALLFIAENTWGKLNNAVIILIILLGSITRYFINVFSFSLRLKLSSVAGSLLEAAGFDNTVNGNVIIHEGHSFSVDPECIGLKMVVTAFLFMLLFLAFFERRNRMSTSLTGLSILLLFNVILIVLNNLLRIMALIVFRSEPGSFSHEENGVFGMIIYNILPLYLVTPIIINIFGRKTSARPLPSDKKRKLYPLMLLVIIASLFIFNLNYKAGIRNSFSSAGTISLAGYDKEITDDNVIKLFNEKTLIYIKPPSPFYGSDHNPYICWQGSGYEFKNINITVIAGSEIYISELVSDKGTLYTSWWYDNGDLRTTNQWDWRWRSLKGEQPFSLVNVTCSSREKLEEELSELIPQLEILTGKL